MIKKKIFVKEIDEQVRILVTNNLVETDCSVTTLRENKTLKAQQG